MTAEGRVPPVFLIGYRGTGKTTVARLLAARLGWPWRDADAVLEAEFGRPIRDIFKAEGEAGFRDKETQVLRDLAGLDRHVIATGGGVILRPENRDVLRGGRAVWLTAPPEILWQRLQRDATTTRRRPNLTPQGGLAEVEELLAVRTPLYAAAADFTVDTSHGNPARAAEAIEAWLRGG